MGKAAITYVAAILAGGLGGWGMWYWGPPVMSAQPRPAAQTAPAVTALEATPSGPLVEAALRYADAVAMGDCADVIARTNWMQDRLAYVHRTEGTSEADAAAREDFCRRLSVRSTEGNQLSLEGVGDQYLFRPGGQWTPFALEPGSPGLEKPAKARVWFRVEFPDVVRALRDAAGQPIRSIDAALHLSEDGYVLKAGVEGNLEIDWDSLVYHRH